MSQTVPPTTPAAEPRLERFTAVYQRLNKDNLDQLASIYAPEVEFIDALHRVNGLAELERYFATLYQRLNSCEFHIQQQHSSAEHAFLSWQMHFSHQAIKGGQTVVVDGASLLRFAGDKVVYHRDYLDLGQMLYEQVPVLGSLIRLIKRRASQA